MFSGIHGCTNELYMRRNLQRISDSQYISFCLGTHKRVFFFFVAVDFQHIRDCCSTDMFAKMRGSQDDESVTLDGDRLEANDEHVAHC